MQEGVFVANDTSAHLAQDSGKRAHFWLVENMPLPVLTLVSQAAAISDISVISYAGFSEITHDHASIPAEIDAGLKVSKGSAMR